MQQPNRHASVIVIGDRGLMVCGASGSGKTALCLALSAHCRAANIFARFVSDDQIFVTAASGRLVVEAPDPIFGLAEARGLGPSPVPAVRRAVVDRMIRLVPHADAPRVAEAETEVLEGVEIPALLLPERSTRQAVTAACAWLGLPPFETF